MYSPPPATYSVIRLIWMQILLSGAILLEVAVFHRNTLGETFELAYNAAIEKGYLWQIATAPLAHTNPFHLLFNLLTLWMFGSELEQRWGRALFMRYYSYCAVASVLVFLLLAGLIPAMRNDTFSSSTGANLGLLIAYAIYWPERQVWFFFLFPVRMKFVVLITGLIAIFYAISSAPFVLSAAGHLGGLVAAGLLLLLTGGEPARAARLTTILGNWWRNRIAEKTVPSGRDFEPGEMEAKIDAILDKISRSGMKSLTAAEKKFLREASEKMNKTGR